MKPTKPILALLFLFLLGTSLPAQSYLPFPGQWTCHFAYPDSAGAGTGVLTVRVDSIYPQGPATTYLFNQIVRPIGPNDTIIDCGGQWISDEPGYAIVRAHEDNILGSHCTVYPNGRAEFHTQSGDTFVIETQANLGAAWTFDAANGVTAQVISHGNEQFLGTSDSVKVIELSTGSQIALSKDHGIVRGVSFLPLRALTNGLRLSTSLELWGVEEIGLGNSLPGFDEIFGLFETGDMYQTSTYSYGSYGTNSRKDEYQIISKSVGSTSTSYQVNQETYSLSEIYIWSGGSTLDTTYSPPSAATIEFQRASYTFLDLAHGEALPSGNNYGAKIAGKTELLPDGRILRSFSYFSDYDPCEDVYYSFIFDYYEDEEFEEGLGQVYRWSGGNGYSNSLSFGCYNTAAVGMEGNCLNLAQLAGLDTSGPQPPNDPTGLAPGVYGNALGTTLWLVPGDSVRYLTVWDIPGRKVMEMYISDRDEPYEINAASWKPGVYVFRVEKRDGQVEVFRTGLIK